MNSTKKTTTTANGLDADLFKGRMETGIKDAMRKMLAAKKEIQRLREIAEAEGEDTLASWIADMEEATQAALDCRAGVRARLQEVGRTEA